MIVGHTSDRFIQGVRSPLSSDALRQDTAHNQASDMTNYGFMALCDLDANRVLTTPALVLLITYHRDRLETWNKMTPMESHLCLVIVLLLSPLLVS